MSPHRASAPSRHSHWQHIDGLDGLDSAPQTHFTLVVFLVWLHLPSHEWIHFRVPSPSLSFIVGRSAWFVTNATLSGILRRWHDPSSHLCLCRLLSSWRQSQHIPVLGLLRSHSEGATKLGHEHFISGIAEVQSKKKNDLMYFA
ncbi:hypothetical protein DFH94DRAFT_103126 [Russula ochroleuca]|uniref:Uncharacterized protein n=1 Tax=Russula ochroleuca TaxID=152965 RepID=A0A9P5T639_9AGAM|nr:hypothetical protein DFH94DRAFT_103126 [Russula ochroleuca]